MFKLGVVALGHPTIQEFAQNDGDYVGFFFKFLNLIVFFNRRTPLEVSHKYTKNANSVGDATKFLIDDYI